MPPSGGESNSKALEGGDIAVGVMALIVATALTIFTTYYVLHRFVLDDPNDPLTKRGGLEANQDIK